MNFSIFNRIKTVQNNRTLSILFLNTNEQISVSLQQFIDLKTYGNLFVVCKSPFQIGPLRGRLGQTGIKFILPHQIPPNIKFDIIIVDSLQNESLSTLIEYFKFEYVYSLTTTSTQLTNYYKFDQNCFKYKFSDVTDDEEETQEIESNPGVVVDADEKENENLEEGDYQILVKDFAIQPMKYDKYRINYLAPAVPGKVSIIMIVSALTDTFLDVLRDLRSQEAGLVEYIVIDNFAGFRSNVKPNIRYGSKMPIDFCKYHAREISTGEYLIFLDQNSQTFQLKDYLEKGMYQTR